MGRIILVTGGARSGKSTYAEEAAKKLNPKNICYIATSEVTDKEMEERIQKHKERRGSEFTTIEESTKLSYALKKAENISNTILVDCLTVWLGNLFYYNKVEEELNNLYAYLKTTDKNIILVSNETGNGIVPETELGRKYRDVSGFMNQNIAKLSSDVILTVCGIPIAIKGSLV